MGVLTVKAPTDGYRCRPLRNDAPVADYNMSSGVLCGWEKVRMLNLTSCDCTLENNRANQCGREHALAMALQGVICGNCPVNRVRGRDMRRAP